MSPSSKPNLVVLLADDHPAYVISADGNVLARTPNLDQLAGRASASRATSARRPSAVRLASACSPANCLIRPASACSTRRCPPRSPPSPSTSLRRIHTAVIGTMHCDCSPEPPHPGIYGFELPMADQNAWQNYRDSVADRALEFRYVGARMPLPECVSTTGTLLTPHASG